MSGPLAKPSVFPVWAVMDQQDPVSGQNNVLTPPAEKQQFGWTRLEFPPRNWFNWLARYTNNWLQYLAQQEGQAVVADGSGSSTLFDVVNGGLGVLWVVDTGGASNFYNGMAYIPPAPGSAITLNKIAGTTLTVSTISTSGKVTVSGGTGPYLLWAQTKTTPS